MNRSSLQLHMNAPPRALLTTLALAALCTIENEATAVTFHTATPAGGDPNPDVNKFKLASPGAVVIGNNYGAKQTAGITKMDPLAMDTSPTKHATRRVYTVAGPKQRRHPQTSHDHQMHGCNLLN